MLRKLLRGGPTIFVRPPAAQLYPVILQGFQWDLLIWQETNVVIRGINRIARLGAKQKDQKYVPPSVLEAFGFEASSDVLTFIEKTLPNCS
jgi:hypothetical protein